MEFFDVFEKVCAALIGLACLVLLARQFMGTPRRARLDRTVRGAWRALRTATLRLYHWPSARRRARQEAAAAIRRARGDEGEWDGNVYRTKQPRRPRKLH